MSKDKLDKYVKVYLTDEEHTMFKIVCAKQKLPMTTVLRKIVVSWVEKYSK